MRAPRIKGLLDVNWGGPGPESWPLATLFKTGQELPQDTTLAYRDQNAVSVAISLVAEDAATVPFELFRKDENGDISDEPVEDHWVLRAWDSPNDYVHGSQFWIGTYTIWLLFGEHFWYYPDLMQSTSRELDRIRGDIQFLNPNSVWRDSDGVWKLRNRNGTDQPLDYERMTIFKRFNPYDYFRGMSRFSAVLSEIRSDLAASSWNQRFFSDQNGIPSGLIKPPQGTLTTPDQREEVARIWNQKHSRRRSVGVLPGGWDFIDSSMSHRDMDFSAMRDKSRELILAAGGTPPFLAGMLDKADYANAKKQEELYWQGTIKRIVGHAAETINHSFLRNMGVEDVVAIPKWEVVTQLVEDVDGKSEIAKKWFAMGLSKKVINERLDMGWNPDDVEDYEQAYIPLGLVPVGETGMMSPAGPANEPLPQEETDGEGRGLSQETLDRMEEVAREARRSMVWRNLIIRTKDLETRFESRVRSHFERLRKEVERNLMERFSRGLEVGVTKQETTYLLFDLDKADEGIQRITKPIYEQSYKRGGESILTDLGLAISFNLEDPLVLSRLELFATKITGINATVDKQVRNAIIEGIRAGDPPEAIATRVRHVFNVSKTRARTIARTEVGQSFNDARHTTMMQQGVRYQEWLSSRDPDVRDTHIAADGEVVPIGASFPATGLRYPQDPSGPASEIINCRCVALPVIDRG